MSDKEMKRKLSDDDLEGVRGGVELKTNINLKNTIFNKDEKDTDPQILVKNDTMNGDVSLLGVRSGKISAGKDRPGTSASFGKSYSRA